MTDCTGATTATTPERVAEHNAALNIDYIRQVREMGITNAEQFRSSVTALNEAADNRLPKLNREGLPLEG